MNHLQTGMTKERLGKEYYIESRDFSVPELKILKDVVQAANFITDKKTTALVNKIASQT